MIAKEIELNHDAVKIISAMLKYTGSVILKQEDLSGDMNIEILQFENGDLKVKLRSHD